MICEICHKEFINFKGLGSHISQHHHIKSKEYYDKYLKQNGEGICSTCGKETPFLKLSKGYQKHCSLSCGSKDSETLLKVIATRKERFGVENFFQNKDIQYKAEQKSHSDEANEKKKQTSLNHYGVENPMQSKEVIEQIQKTNLERYGSKAYNREKGKATMKEKYGYEHALQISKFQNKAIDTLRNRQSQYEIEHNCTKIKDLFLMYGTGWYQAHLVPIITDNETSYVSNTDIDTIIKYSLENHLYTSMAEKSIVEYIKTFYNGTIIENTRTTIHRGELDIFIPDLKLAIEYNGTYWHDYNKSNDREYHLRKSIKCRNKGIRLIHIYEFEDIFEQKKLLKDLILGEDNYPKDDFNKNNLIDSIPEPEIIYNENGSIIYGAGKLVQNNTLNIDMLVEVKD